jgi:tRNA-2-methylthio-N6-dimethylallyladenosine synthase
LAAVDELQQKIQSRKNATLEGKIYDVLVEGDKRGRLHGRNRGDKLIYLTNVNVSEAPKAGETVNVQITASSPWSLEGELVEQGVSQTESEKVPVA